MKMLNFKKIKVKNYLTKSKDKLKNLISTENISKIKSFKIKDVFVKSKDNLKKIISTEKISRIKNFNTKDFLKIGKRKLFKLTSNYQNYAEKFVSNLVKEEGSEIWSGLSQSQKWSGRLIWTFVGVTAFSAGWSFFTLIDDTIQVQGKIEPKGTTIEVKVPLGGVIKKIAVKEGEIVTSDQVLLELDTTAVKSKLKALQIVQSQIKADILLSKIQLGDDIEVTNLTPNQKIKLMSLISEYDSRINAAKNSVEQAKIRLNTNLEQIKTLKDVLLIREEVLTNLKELSEVGGLSKVKYLKEQQEVIQLQGRLISSQNELKTSTSILNEAENKLSNTIAATKIDFATKIEENEKQLAQIQNQINEAALTLSYQEINSPVKGIVFDLQPAAPGYVVDTQFPILKIVPIDELVARVFVSNRDIAFLKNGQLVKVRVDAYPYNEFGEIIGKIDSIGSDVLEPDQNFNFYRFPVTIKFENPYILHKKIKLPLRTGMSLTANIVLRQRPVISLFTERILPFWSGLEQL
tara:strand:+ start:32 stop:1591 length:1560 start_codon:yes stop_codon:yes gene_type:complete